MRVRRIEDQISEREGPWNCELEEGSCFIADSDGASRAIAERVGIRRGAIEGSGVREAYWMVRE